MISEKVQKAFNDQINAELYSAYMYLAMVADLESKNLVGMAQWMKVQATEEVGHAMKLFGHVVERGGRAVLGAIAEPPGEWATPLELFEAAYAHEQKVTALINKLVDVADAESDRAAHIFLQWFVTEQVEEEASTQEIRDKLKLAGDSPVALFMIDQQLGQRTPPAAPTAQA